MKSDQEHTSLFCRIGGHACVRRIVDVFYNKVLDDYRVSRFFETIDMERQRTKLVAFLTYALGGGTNFTGASMRKAHERMVREGGLNDEHFDVIVEIIAGTLKEVGIPAPLINEVRAILEPTRDDVLNR
ncbi:MAG: group 1 truncated hemoglobin [Proteobacteria bacterium]|nr:group 1 truncated hemoglobin [Pseudomonadota bacterium]